MTIRKQKKKTPSTRRQPSGKKSVKKTVSKKIDNQAKKRASTKKKDPEYVSEDQERVWVTPGEFQKFLVDQGIKISRKNLYATYLGKSATNPLPRSSDGKRVHKWKGLEIIRMVQGKESVNSTNALARRQEADARIREARAIKEEMMIAEMKGTKIDMDIVRTVICQAVENMKSELRNIEHSLPFELKDKSETDIGRMLRLAHDQALENLCNII